MTQCHKAARIVFVIGLAAATGCGAPGPAVKPREPQLVALPREPHLGLRCRPDTHPCDRIGLAVQVAHPVRSVRATVDGHALRLHTRPGRGGYARGLFWQGVFRDRRAEQLADDFPKRLHVELRFETFTGNELLARADLIVSAGYG